MKLQVRQRLESQRKIPRGVVLVLLEEESFGSLAVTKRSRRLGERRKATTGSSGKTSLQRLEE